MPQQQPWKPWTNTHVVNASLPGFALRTCIEQEGVRAYLRRIGAANPLQSACEIGCGFGRMIVVLGEFAQQVVGFERQPEFVEQARPLHPSFSFHQVESLGHLPVPDHSFDLLLSFTVLQHLTENAIRPAIAEIKRVVRPTGFVLLCEDTNFATPFGDINDDTGFCVIGRSIETYAQLLAPFRLTATSKRIVEPTCPHKDVGAYMVFQR